MWQKFVDEGPVDSNIPDFSYTGFFAKNSAVNAPPEMIFNVLDFNAIPDDGIDDSQSIQAAIDAANENGEGIVFLPKGRYLITGGEAANILKISSSNIIIRGESDRGENASVLFLKNPSSGKEFGLIGQNNADLRSIAAISIEGEQDNTVLASFTDKDFSRGTRIIEVGSTANFRPHQTIRVLLSEAQDDATSPSQDNDSLVNLLTYPFEFTEEQSLTLGRYGQTVEYITKIRKVVDDTHIELYQPLRFDHLKQHSPTIMAFTGLTNVGIEHIRFESAWLGQYIHHAPYPADSVGSDIIRSEREQDYGWVALWGTWLSDSWISNVTFNNFTQNIILSNSSFTDINDITLQGNGGHAGITYSSAYNILTTNVHIQGDFVHPLSIRAWTSGCVFKDISIDTTKFNALDRTGPFIDLHGLYPYENLFENLTGFYVHSGGDLGVLPHSGVRNTFWNIQAPDEIERFDYAIGEFFNTAATQVNKMYQYYPSSIVVGVYRVSGGEVTINRNPNDRVEPFMQIYNLNQRVVSVESLFNSQVLLRQAAYPLLPEPPILLLN
ncbi:putative virulence factor (pectin lyase fold protein) [Glaciecola nitratireducens FR1064]|uniref:Putative virulence factor (Pectin lyase fold protein) n=2 Tax=Brumicola TaxID=3160924 RepID=G4QNH8_GLANF|nr:putative virulence factor (pectin lyase fold protein) [Glaciecola nitratireducens FR1064]